MRLFFTRFLFPSIILFLSEQSSFAQSGLWTWMKGDSIPGSTAVYGTQGVPDAANTPGAMYETYNWTDLDGNLWLFGGLQPYTNQLYSALWKYSPGTGMWVWVKGPNTINEAGVYGTQGIPSPDNYPGARSYGGLTWTDPQNHLWMYAGYGNDNSAVPTFLGDLWMYDIATNEWTWMSGPDNGIVYPNYDSYQTASANNIPGSRAEDCVSWLDTLGNLWFYGGENYFGGEANDMWKYDRSVNLWAWMHGDGVTSTLPVYGNPGEFDSSFTPGGRWGYCRWQQGNQFYFFGGFSVIGSMSDLWQYNANTNEWAWISGSTVGQDSGSYGDYCDTSVANYPCGRMEDKACWTDHCGNLWLYSGSIAPNDLWTFRLDSKEWALVHGNFTNPAEYSFYGIMGTAQPANHPGIRYGAVSWVDDANQLWLFGGLGQNATSVGAYNDLWRYVADADCFGCQLPSFAASNQEVCEKFCVDFYDSSTNNPTSWQWIFEGGSPPSSTDQNPVQICYNEPGLYDVTLITCNITCDTVVIHDYVTVFATPSTPVITQNGNVLTSSVAVSYQWQLNNTDIPGATGQSYTFSQSGTYTVIIMDDHGCVSSSDILITGIDDHLLLLSASLQPNPNNGSFVVEFHPPFSSDVTLTIVDCFGKKIYESKEGESGIAFKKEISLSPIASGIYFLEITTGDDCAIKKVVIN